jgi:DNA-directed RNA polymerase specialized sigma24 family protein
MLTLANNVSTRRSTAYAAADDFCRIFAQDMNSLFLLAFLLTGDRKKAEECFASALEDATKSNRIFKDWARSWSQRTIIENAIRMIGPTPEQAPDRRREMATLRAIDTEVQRKGKSDESLDAILSLASFERFVFVMSILERYSDQDCSILLACSRRDVVLARAQAAEHIALFANPILPEATRGAGTFVQENLLPASA